jgi:hypothetical protein
MPSLTEVPAPLTQRWNGSAAWKLYGARCRLRRRVSDRVLRSCLRRHQDACGGKRKTEGSATRYKLTSVVQIPVHGVISFEPDSIRAEDRYKDR